MTEKGREPTTTVIPSVVEESKAVVGRARVEVGGCATPWAVARTRETLNNALGLWHTEARQAKTEGE